MKGDSQEISCGQEEDSQNVLTKLITLKLSSYYAKVARICMTAESGQIQNHATAGLLATRLLSKSLQKCCSFYLNI